VSRAKGALLLIFLGAFLFSCARPRLGLPPPPKARDLTALVRFRLVAPKRRLSGKAVILVRPGELYIEAFSPFGGILFRFWFERGLVVWEEGVGGPVQGLRFRDLPPVLAEALPYLVLGRWPKETSLRPGSGYHLKSTEEGWRLTYFQRTLMEILPEVRRIFLSFPSLHVGVELKIREIRTGAPEIPSRPQVTPRLVNLHSLFVPEGD